LVRLCRNMASLLENVWSQAGHSCMLPPLMLDTK
jgi:hypothetical protein